MTRTVSTAARTSWTRTIEAPRRTAAATVAIVPWTRFFDRRAAEQCADEALARSADEDG